MAISTTYAPDSYTGNGILDTYTITFNYLTDTGNVKVTVANVLKTLGTHYTFSSSNVVFEAGSIPADTVTVLIELNLDFLQETVYQRNSVFPSATVEADLDRLTLMAQVLDLRLDGVTSGAGSGDLISTNNLSDVVSASTARTNLGLGTAATTAVSDYATASHTHVTANITDITSTAAELNILDGVTSTASELNILDGATLTVAELNYVEGVTSAIQDQLDAKVATSVVVPYDAPFMAGFDSTGVAEDVAVQAYGFLAMSRAGSFTGETGYADLAPTGAAMILDIEKNGTTIYTTKPQFAATSNTLTVGALKTDGTEDFVSGDRITFKITQKGSSLAGNGVRFTVKATTGLI